jgi:hypothetical protein
MKLAHSALVRSNVPVRWVATRYPGIGKEHSEPADLRPGTEVKR